MQPVAPWPWSVGSPQRTVRVAVASGVLAVIAWVVYGLGLNSTAALVFVVVWSVMAVSYAALAVPLRRGRHTG